MMADDANRDMYVCSSSTPFAFIRMMMDVDEEMLEVLLEGEE